MPSHGPISCWIQTPAKRLEEYGTNATILQDGTPKITCWIPSKHNEEFVVYYKNTERATATSFRLCIDGVACPWTYLYSKPHKSAKKDDTTRLTGVRVSENLKMPYMFCNVVLTEGESQPMQRVNPGEIAVTIHEAVLKTHHRTPKIPGRPELSSAALVSERTKKGLDHVVQLGDARVVQPRPASLPSFKRGAVLVTFVFRYKPFDVLRADGVVPHAMTVNTPSTCEIAPAVIDLTLGDDEERREMVLTKQIHDLQAELKRLQSKKRKYEGNTYHVKKEPKYT